jgi:hypothetical protein
MSEDETTAPPFAEAIAAQLRQVARAEEDRAARRRAAAAGAQGAPAAALMRRAEVSAARAAAAHALAARHEALLAPGEGTLVHGRVVDAEGRGIAGVLVRARSQEEAAGEGRTDADGHYAFAATAAAGTALHLEVLDAQGAARTDIAEATRVTSDDMDFAVLVAG